MSDAERDKLLTTLSIRTTALRDMVALLLALEARASLTADGLFREVSAGLDKRLDSLRVTEPNLVPHIERLRGEFDWLVKAARAMLGEIR